MAADEFSYCREEISESKTAVTSLPSKRLWVSCLNQQNFEPILQVGGKMAAKMRNNLEIFIKVM